MPRQTFRTGRIPDNRVLQLLEEVMARWPTNHPLMAVGGFSYSRPSPEWLQALEDASSFVVSSATVSERDALFTLHFRRGRDAASPDEVTLSWRDGLAPDAPFGEADAQALLGMVKGLAPALSYRPAPED